MSTSVLHGVPAAEPVQPLILASRERKLSASPQTLFNRELSLLEFDRRVLEEALDAGNPLLERLKFLSIFSSNIDEFFMIRVSSLKERAEAAKGALLQGGTCAEVLAQIRGTLLPMFDAQMECLRSDILPRLKAVDIELAVYDALTEIERYSLRSYFAEKVFPMLTPLAVDPSHPFPYISPSSVNLGLMVQAPADSQAGDPVDHNPEGRFVRIKVPSAAPRMVPVGTSNSKFVLLEEIIAANVATLFPGMAPGPCHTFRVTRDADLELRDEEAEDLLLQVQEELSQRRFGAPVRLEVSPKMPAEMVQYLSSALDLGAEDVFAIDGPLNLQDVLGPLHDLDRPELKDVPFEPAMPPSLATNVSIFDVLKERDVLLHHPYDSYGCVTDFVESAVKDPNVVAIKICIYRTGADSPIPSALIKASEQGKQVTALIELKARFDEAHNIEWAKRLDAVGAHVVYGVVGLKTHGKLTLVVRREGDLLRRYVHIATGNYNPTTSCTYTDLGLLTSDEAIGADASELFNYLTGSSRQAKYRKLIVAPVNLRQRMIALIDREIANRKAGRPAHIIAKINRLADEQMIEKLYEASRAGVEIDLIVRGICMLRPGVSGMSETIRVRSIVGRFLEHSRIFCFANGGDEEVYIGSADWMRRNLDRRIEVVTPIRDQHMRGYLKDVVMAAYLRDNVRARRLRPDGKYERFDASADERFDVQQYFIDSATGRNDLAQVSHLNNGRGHVPTY